MTKEKQEALGDKDAYVIKVLKLEALLDELQKDSGQQNKKSTEQTVVGWLCRSLHCLPQISSDKYQNSLHFTL